MRNGLKVLLLFAITVATPLTAQEKKPRPTLEEEQKKLLGVWEFKPNGKKGGKDDKENIVAVSLTIRESSVWLFLTAEDEKSEKYFRSGTFGIKLEEKGKDRVITLSGKKVSDNTTATFSPLKEPQSATYRFEGDALKLEGGELLWLKLTGEWTRKEEK